MQNLQVHKLLLKVSVATMLVCGSAGHRIFVTRRHRLAVLNVKQLLGGADCHPKLLLRSQPAPGLSRVTPRFSAARAHPFSFMLGCFALLVLLDSFC